MNSFSSLTPLVDSLRRHVRLCVLVVAVAAATAATISMSADRRYRATAEFPTSQGGGTVVRETLEARARSLRAAFELDIRGIDLEVQPATTKIVRVSALSAKPDDLTWAANTVASDLLAWELGRRESQREYRRLLERLAALKPADPARGDVERSLDEVRPRAIDDSRYTAAQRVVRVDGPAPVLHGTVAAAVGLLLALAFSLRLDAPARLQAG
jgi:hypothetical protein